MQTTHKERYHENCKGCRLNEDSRYCAFSDGLIAEYCPCLLCLVKPICDKKGCRIRPLKYFKQINVLDSARNYKG